MIWFIVAAGIAAVLSVVSVTVIVMWERRQQLLLREKIEAQLKLQEDARVEAIRVAETELRVSTAKWSKRA